ncbi:MAG: HlyD family efflux transporter periplasmic adaptor subunit [Spirochaetaceae bacterium]|jgi:multidrug efflux pump subunit AcrA (membrane-fusion protein)|nr:HlyD family efflux transporter periplasmic adaptor subunit [Spirochaetaceae bacterium]
MKRGGKKLPALIIAALIVLLGVPAGSIAYRRFFTGAGAQNTSYRVRGETYTNIIEIAGVISAAQEQNLQAAGDGIVTSVYVKEGDRVTKGQFILQLDDSEQRYNLERHDFDMAQKRVNSSPREIQLMTLQREVLEQRIKDRRIIANFTGIIAQFSIAVGDVMEAKDSAGVIIDRGYLKATVEVAETDAPKLRPGQKVTFKFPALDGADTVIEGYVHSFPAVATKSARGASVVKAEIRIDEPPDLILPNYSFTGEIEISPPVTMLLVERSAIGYEGPAENAAPRGTDPPALDNGEATRPGGGRAYAEKVLPGGGVERVFVQVEPYGEEFVRIKSGLAAGDELKAQESAALSGRSQRNDDRQNRQRGAQPVMPMMGGRLR